MKKYDKQRNKNYAKEQMKNQSIIINLHVQKLQQDKLNDNE